MESSRATSLHHLGPTILGVRTFATVAFVDGRPSTSVGSVDRRSGER